MSDIMIVALLGALVFSTLYFFSGKWTERQKTGVKMDEPPSQPKSELTVKEKENLRSSEPTNILGPPVIERDVTVQDFNSTPNIKLHSEGIESRDPPTLFEEQDTTTTTPKEVCAADRALCNEFSMIVIGNKEKLNVFQPNMTEEKAATLKTFERIDQYDTVNKLGEDNLCDAFSALDVVEKPQSIINAEATKKWLSTQEDDFELGAKAVGAFATEWHRSLPYEGGHAHSLLVCYYGRLMDEAQSNHTDGIPHEVIDALGELDDRGGTSHPMEFFQEFFLTKQQDRLRKKALAKMFPKEGQERLLHYLRDGKCSQGGAVKGPWYGARCFAHLPLWPADDTQINAADVCQGDIDDCYFACGLSLAAEHYPTCLKERIIRIDDKENGRSRFKVQHWSERRGGCMSPNPKSRRGPNITEVGDTFYAHRRVNRKGGPGVPLYCRSRSGALYPMVFERTFQKYRRGGDHGSYEDIAGRNCLEAEAVLHFLTGLKFDQMRLSEDHNVRISHASPAHQDKIWKIICDALHKGRAISTGTCSLGSRIYEKPHEEWEDLCIVPDHNYALLDAGTDSVYGRFVVLRNPFGKQLSPFVLPSVSAWPEGVVDGPELGEDAVFRLGLSEFFSYFETISYATETCKWYPIRRCHQYREFFSDSENIEWCNETLLNEEKARDTLAPRRLEFE
mmetsp:Transcript_7533/g.11797  ORF Transcript_7533/g.11797 Transcript_7533/m.11797 type:complete len:677 (-) Transcript_7533:50-2080(-)